MTTAELRRAEVASLESGSGRHRKRPSPDLVVAAVLGVLVATGVAFGIARYPGIGGDEGIYTEQAWAVLHGSLTPYTYTYDHPFIGWLQLSAPAFVAQRLHLGGQLSVIDDRSVMVLYALATTMLTFGVARRLGMRLWSATLAVALMGLCPLFTYLARQVFLDNIAVPWLLLALFLVLSPRQRQWTYAIAGCALGIAILSKETLALIAPAVFYALWTRSYKPLRAMACTVFVGLATVTLAIHPLFAALRHELLPGANHVSIWTNEIEYQLVHRGGSGAFWDANSGRYDLLSSWFGFDRYLLLGGAAAALVCLGSRRFRTVGIALLLFAVPVVKPGGYLPAMYVTAGLPFAALAIAGVLDGATDTLRRWGLRPALALSLVALVALPAAVPVARSDVREQRIIQTSGPVSYDAAALSYVETHASRRARVLTDDGFWVDLARAGFSASGWNGPISYYRYDLDPVDVAKYVPHGWQDINWILSTGEMRQFNTPAQPGYAVYQHATIVAEFGAGQQRVSVYRVDRTAYNALGFAAPN